MRLEQEVRRRDKRFNTNTDQRRRWLDDFAAHEVTAYKQYLERYPVHVSFYRVMDTLKVSYQAWIKPKNFKSVRNAVANEEFLKDKNEMIRLDWAPHSPDINPIDNVWFMWKARFRKVMRDPKKTTSWL
jgi:hypothetical protein